MAKVTFRVADPALSEGVLISNYDLTIQEVVPYGGEVSVEINVAQSFRFSSWSKGIHVTLGYGGSSAPAKPEHVSMMVQPGRTYEIGVTRRHAFDVAGQIAPRIVG